MSVCVVISVRNGAAYLAEALDSILSQEGVELELRLYDNGSTDGSIRIAHEYAADDPRVSVTLNGDGLGYYDNIDRGLRETGCRYLAPFAADDLMCPGNLASKIALLERTGAGLAHSRVALADESGRQIGLSCSFDHVPELLPAPEFLRHLVPVNTLSCQSVVARVAALRQIDGFDCSAWYCGDWLAWMQLSLRVAVVTIREPLVVNRVHTSSGTHASQRTGAFAPHCEDALDRVLADDCFPADWAAERTALRAGLRLALARDLASHGHVRCATVPGAYAYSLRALSSVWHRAEAAATAGRLLDAAGLEEPDLPFALVARAPAGVRAAARLVEECASLASDGLLGSVTLTADPTDVDAAAELLTPIVDSLPVDVDLVPTDLTDALVPGRLLVAPAGSPDIALAEAVGVPALPYDVPLPPPAWLTRQAALVDAA